MKLSPIHQRYLDVYPIRFTKTIRPPLWFWLRIDTLPDTISDSELKVRAMFYYDEDKDDLEDVRRELIEDIYIKAYTFTDDGESGTPCTIGLKDLTLDISEEEIIAKAIADYEDDKSVVKKLNDYYQKRKDNEEE